MFKFIAKSLKWRMVSLFLMGTMIPIAIVLSLAFHYSSVALEEDAFDKLDAVREIKKNQIRLWFEERVGDVNVLSQSKDVTQAVEILVARGEVEGDDSKTSYNVDTAKYRAVADQLDPFFGEYVAIYGYPDIYLISKDDGYVMYTQARESDLGTSLKNGFLKESSLAVLWENVLKCRKGCIVDFADYEPSGKPAAFVGSPVLDEKGDITAVLALQLDTHAIDAVMQERTGMGETGETYLVGCDMLMRSDSRFDQNSTILKKRIDTEAVRAALDGEAATRIIDNYRGVEVLSAFSTAGLKDAFGTDFEWVICSEKDTSEAFAPVHALAFKIAWIGLVLAALAGFAGYIAARSITNPLTEGAHTLAFSVGEISATSAQLATCAQETSTAVAEILTTVEEVRQTAGVSNDKARGVADRAGNISRTSDDGQKATEEAVNGMGRVKDEMEYIAESIVRLSDQTHSISKIIGAVHGLADQSNLLSVNASIEAAKAGEYGKGFAVVAQEVKSLADQSRGATDQVKTILSEIEKATSAAVMATERGNRAVEDGVGLSSQAGETISMLVSGVSDSVQAATQIAASSQEQVVGIDQLAVAIESIREASGQNVDGARQLEDATAGLNELAQKMKSMVDGVKV
jgi:methyl-accepting chemotaxis protein